MFLCFGLFMFMGRFFFDAWLRSRTRYALTDTRALIDRAAPFSSFSAVRLDRTPEIQIRERGHGRGTIRFGASISPFARGNFGTWSPALDPTPQFLAIDNARNVFDLVQQSASRRG